MAKPIKRNGKWRIRWTDAEGIRRSATFSSRKEATSELRKRELEVEECRRGLKDPLLNGKTFDDVWNYWVKYRLPQKRSPKDDISIYRAHLKPFFQGKKLCNIKVADIDRFKAEKGHLAPKTLNNIETLFISLMNLAHELEWLLRVPKIRKTKVRMNSKEYSYLRSREEIDRFLGAARIEGESVYILYSAAIHTGMRAGELAGLRWEDVDLDRRQITVQRSYNGPTKSNDIRYVPIVNGLYKDLLDWKMKASSEIVFPNRDGNMFGKSARIFQEIFHRVLDRAKFSKILKNGKERRYIVFHGLRHTFASHWVMTSGDIFKLQKILGHKQIEMTMRYSHLDPRCFQEDFDRLDFSLSSGSNNLLFFQN